MLSWKTCIAGMLLCGVVLLFNIVQVSYEESATTTSAGGAPLCREEPETNVAPAEIERTRIVYMLQGYARQYQQWADRVASLGANATLLYHSFDQDCEGCIFRTNTTYASGNNLLIRQAQNISNVKYVITLDPDNAIKCQGELSQLIKTEDCWLALHKMLLDSQTMHPIIGAQTHHDPEEPTMYQTCIDSQFFVLRWDFVPFFYPLATHDMDKGWNLINHVIWHLTDRCYPNAFLVDGRFRMGNPLHRNYVQNYGVDAQNIINGILEHDYPELGPWDYTKRWAMRCSVSPSPPRALYPNPNCLETMDTRFRTWLNKDDSLLVDLEVPASTI